MRVAWLQHVPFEGLGAIEAWAKDRSVALTAVRLWQGDPLPDLDALDGVIVLGGPMSVNDTDGHPWLVSEIDWVSRALNQERPTLGICLGAQIMARALGKPVYSLGQPEIGWFEVSGIPDRVFSMPKRFHAFHWHGETFDLPDDARVLAATEPCPHQAFAIDWHALGLQFHLEMTADGAKRLAANCPQDLAPGRWVQPAQEQIANSSHFQQAHGMLHDLLDQLFRG